MQVGHATNSRPPRIDADDGLTVVSAVVVGSLTALALGAGAVSSPAVVGAEVKGPRGRAYVVVSLACAAVTGTIIGVGVYGIRGGDWTPLFVAFGGVFAEFVVFV